jgi:branched-subunit amino acid ABC-type transport system permease component
MRIFILTVIACLLGSIAGVSLAGNIEVKPLIAETITADGFRVCDYGGAGDVLIIPASILCPLTILVDEDSSLHNPGI